MIDFSHGATHGGTWQRIAALYQTRKVKRSVQFHCNMCSPVRHVAPNGKVRVLMTNLFDTRRFPASAFGELYHKR